MTRVCEWCSAPLNDYQLVACSASHRLKRWRWLNGMPDRKGGIIERPPPGSVLVEGPWARDRRAGAVQTAPGGAGRPSRVSNGGLQVSFWKAVRALGGEPLYLTETMAVRALTPALSERQRGRLLATREPIPGQLGFEEAA